MSSTFYKIITIVAFAVLLVSCKDDSVSLGTVKYYPGFLWVDSNITPVTQTFDLDFSADAKADANSFAEFQFVDNNGTPIGTNVMQVTIDGKQIPNNKFRVNSNETSKKVTFTFSPDAKNGKHQGYLRLVSHNLDRLDSQELKPGQKVDAFQWTLTYDKGMNPLAQGLLWFLAVVAALLILWFIILKNIFYPRIRLSRLDLSSSDGYYQNKKINGKRLVVVTNKYKPQGWFSKIFTGEILYIKDDRWTAAWELSPKGRKKALKISLHGKYMIDPVTSQLENYGEYQLQNMETNSITTIKIL